MILLEDNRGGERMILYITERNIRVDGADNQISYNSDYIAEFHFDDEWNGKIKTARFIQNGEYFDVVLVDDRCEIPPLKTGFVRVGVFTDSMTSTYADAYFKTSIKDGSGNPTEPPEDVYAQLTTLIKSGMLKGDKGDKGDPREVVQVIGQSETAVMSQKAVTDNLSGKLSEPVEGLAVGKYFRVVALDENGHAVLEAVDAKTIGVQDVIVDGNSIVKDGIADIPIVTGKTAGVAKYTPNQGMEIYGKYVGLKITKNVQIDGRLTIGNDGGAILSQNFDYAVKAAMCDGKGAAWTADEQAAARERIGIPGDYELIASIELTEPVIDADITQDINGNDLCLQSCVVRVFTNAAEKNATMWISAMPNVGTSFDDSIRFSSSIIRTVDNISFCVFNRLGLVTPIIISQKAGVVAPVLVPSYTVGYNVKKLLFSGAGGNYIPVGTKFDVYGVRA